MSEQPDAEAEEFDLTDVPMDAAEVDGEDGGEGGEEGEGPEGRQQQAVQPLAPEELTKRLTNTKTALAAERRARRDLEHRLSDLTDRVNGDGRGQPVQRQRQEEADADIDIDTDPIAALRQLKAKVSAYEQADREAAMTEEQRSAREAAYSRVEEAFQEHEADFREEHPDYDEAAKHYAVARAQELMQFGIVPQQIQGMLREEFATLAATAMRANKNPAAAVYEMAKGRGYGKAAGGEGAGNAKLDAVARGQRATSPLSRPGGRAATGLDAATVANIDIRSKKGAEAFEKGFAALERQAKASR